MSLPEDSRRVVIGISGGRDSTQALREIGIHELAGDAFAAIGHDPAVENVTFENVQARSGRA